MSPVRAGGLADAVAERMRTAILSGEWRAGLRLPPELDLAGELGVSRATLRDALKVLERERLVTRRQRAGTRVAQRPEVQHPLQRNYGVAELIESSGAEHGILDAQIRFSGARTDVAAALGLEPGSRVVILERTRTADERPVVRTVDHVDARIVASATAPLLPEISFYRWLHDHCGIAVSYGIARVKAMLVSNEIAGALRVARRQPMLTLMQTDYTRDGRPVLFSIEYHVAEAFDATIVRDGPY